MAKILTQEQKDRKSAYLHVLSLLRKHKAFRDFTDTLTIEQLMEDENEIINDPHFLFGLHRP
jgi:hypothetical protein